MKFYALLILCFLLSCPAIAAGDWRTFSHPFPIRGAVAHGDGVLLATDGGIRYRTMDGDFVFHSEDGLETSSFYAVAKSSLGVFAVSEYGLIATMTGDGSSWRVVNRSYLTNNVRVRPDIVTLAGSILVIAFDDRLAFFDLVRSVSVLTIEKIADRSMSISPVDKLVARGDSLYVRMGDKAYVRKMNWKDLGADYQLSNPESWSLVKDMSKVSGLPAPDLSKIEVDGDTLGFDFLFEKKDPDSDKMTSRIKWIVKIPRGYFLISDEMIIFYNGKPKEKGYVNVSDFATYMLGETYEISALPVGGAIAASPQGGLSYCNGNQWRETTYPLEKRGSYSSAYSVRMKMLSSTPDGHVFFHIWGHGYFIYSNWGERLEHSFLATDDLCFDSFLSETPYVVSTASAPAPDGSGFLTVASSTDGYTVVYFTNDGDVHCAKNIGSSSLAGPMIARTAEDGSWRLYIGSRDGAAIQADGGLDEIRFPAPKSNGGELSDGTVKLYRGLNTTLVDMVYDTVANRLWVASMANLAYLDEELDTLMTPTSVKGLRGADYTSLDVDVHGNLWVGTANQGAYRLSLKGKSPDTLSVEHFTARMGLLSDDVSDISVDAVLGAVWFSHGKGVSRYFRNDLKYAEKNMTDSSSADVVAYPVPFRPMVHDHFTIDHIAEDAVVSIFNRGGALIRSFSGNDILGGRLEWNGLGKDDKLVAPGVYYYVVRTSSKTKKGKFLIIH